MITEQMHHIWAEVLGLDDFSDDDDFFVLGGHSLLMVRMQALIKQHLGVEVPMDELFERPTVAGVCAYLESGASL
ncbi:acyl carrier protein [Streptomyces sp. NPDC090077]|uniref:acyl carrier protein n=1 Tax=Streptomyces sp. NPDC090077 TaxID=3365938 RepID=UPI0038211BA8